MTRTIDTAKPWRDAVKIERQIRDGLKKIKYGQWEGQTLESVRQEYAEEYINSLAESAWNAANGGETSVQIASPSPCSKESQFMNQVALFDRSVCL